MSMKMYPVIPADERRLQGRHVVSLDAEVQVPLVAHGSPILAAKAVIEELSATGARIYIPKMEKKQVQTLVNLQDKFSLVYQLPDVKSLSYIWADLAWVDIRPGLSGTSVRIGLDLKNMLPAERHHLEQFLNRVARESGE